MKLYYYSDTDSLYIDLAERPSVTSQEVRPGIVLDLDDQGSVVGIDIDHASSQLDLPSAGSGTIPFEAVRG
jgi:uncharacterized protein YuzE